MNFTLESLHFLVVIMRLDHTERRGGGDVTSVE